jgi:L-glyceraldehyde 3-phosphate reductase
MFIATKAGHDMWDGPFGEFNSRKHLMAGINNSLKRMKLDYVDIFYSHRYDPETPLEETLQTLVDIVRSGKALYVGISKYPADKAEFAYKYLADRDVHCLLYQGKYNMLSRDDEQQILPQCTEAGVGYAAFSPLAQGLLTGKYLNGIPEDSRMAKDFFLKKTDLTPEVVEKLLQFKKEADNAGLTPAQYALDFVLKNKAVTSVIVGASKVKQLEELIF